MLQPPRWIPIDCVISILIKMTCLTQPYTVHPKYLYVKKKSGPRRNLLSHSISSFIVDTLPSTWWLQDNSWRLGIKRQMSFGISANTSSCDRKSSLSPQYPPTPFNQSSHSSVNLCYSICSRLLNKWPSPKKRLSMKTLS